MPIEAPGRGVAGVARALGLALVLVGLAPEGGRAQGTASAARSTDEAVDLALSALEEPAVPWRHVPPATPPGTPVWPPYKQQPPAAQQDFRPPTPAAAPPPTTKPPEPGPPPSAPPAPCPAKPVTPCP